MLKCTWEQLGCNSEYMCQRWETMNKQLFDESSDQYEARLEKEGDEILVQSSNYLAEYIAHNCGSEQRPLRSAYVKCHCGMNDIDRKNEHCRKVTLMCTSSKCLQFVEENPGTNPCPKQWKHTYCSIQGIWLIEEDNLPHASPEWTRESNEGQQLKRGLTIDEKKS